MCQIDVTEVAIKKVKWHPTHAVNLDANFPLMKCPCNWLVEHQTVSCAIDVCQWCEQWQKFLPPGLEDMGHHHALVWEGFPNSHVKQVIFIKLAILSCHSILKTLQSLILRVQSRWTTLEVKYAYHVCSHQPANGMICRQWEPLLGSMVRQVLDGFDHSTHNLQKATRLKHEFYQDPAH